MSYGFLNSSKCESGSELNFPTNDSRDEYDSWQAKHSHRCSRCDYMAGNLFHSFEGDNEYTDEYHGSSNWLQQSEDLLSEGDYLTEFFGDGGSTYVVDESSSRLSSTADDFIDDTSSWCVSSSSLSSIPINRNRAFSSSHKYKNFKSQSFDFDEGRVNLGNNSPKERCLNFSGILGTSEKKVINKEHRPDNSAIGNAGAHMTAKDSRAITSETIEKVREAELEDILQHAKDITQPDPSAHVTFCAQPAKLIEGSFHHLLSVRETFSKTGAFKYRSIEISRKCDDELGFSIRKGDGWEKEHEIHISRISLGSVFDMYNLLSVGDELIKVNKVDVRGLSIEDVIRLMYIPTRLTVTIKVLTPFSKRRIARSGISKSAKDIKLLTFEPKRSVDYKIANLRIGGGKRNVSVPGEVATAAQAMPETQTPRRISPYRTAVVGGTMHNGPRPPIPEVSSVTSIDRNGSVRLSKRRCSTVTWSDQISPGKTTI